MCSAAEIACDALGFRPFDLAIEIGGERLGETWSVRVLRRGLLRLCLRLRLRSRFGFLVGIVGRSEQIETESGTRPQQCNGGHGDAGTQGTHGFPLERTGRSWGR